MRAYFTSDTHFNHQYILRSMRRPFATVEEMNEALLENWAQLVRHQDHVYHLGDVAFGNFEQVAKIVQKIRTLPGRKYLIYGNHDYRYPHLLAEAFTEILPPISMLRIASSSCGSVPLVLSHYPLFAWGGLERGTRHLFGHMHGRLSGTDQQTDVGVDCWNYCPVSLEELLAHMRASTIHCTDLYARLCTHSERHGK